MAFSISCRKAVVGEHFTFNLGRCWFQWRKLCPRNDIDRYLMRTTSRKNTLQIPNNTPTNQLTNGLEPILLGFGARVQRKTHSVVYVTSALSCAD